MSKKIINIFLSFLAGAIFLSFFSVIQKYLAGYPIKFKGFYVPILFGGSTGIFVGVMFCKLRQKNIELKFARDKAEESSRLKSEFMKNLSHEIRTPMNGIVGFVNLLNSDIEQTEKQIYTEIIERSTMQLLKIIDNILEISTLESFSFNIQEKAVRVNELFYRLFETYRHPAEIKKLDLRLNISSLYDSLLIQADLYIIEKTISNLVDNAIKFTSKGYVEFGYSLNEEIISVFVNDTGKGINKNNFDMIFECFVQEDKNIASEYGGLGIGLSIVKKYVELLEGQIDMESEVGIGTKFKITFPVTIISQ